MAIDTSVFSANAAPTTGSHPLDPLTPAEIRLASSTITASEYGTDTLRFVMISLQEPAKPVGGDFDLEPVPARPGPRSSSPTTTP